MKERPLKGGYILISLGLIPLSTSYSGSIDYARISKTKKRVVLTGLKVGSEIKPDVVVQPIYGSGKITFSDVYGFDIEVASTGVVTVIQHVAPSGGGTSLYKHHVLCSNNDEDVTINIVLPSDTPLTSLAQLKSAIDNDNGKAIFLNGVDSNAIAPIVDITSYEGDIYICLFDGNAEWSSRSSMTFVSDTVTDY